MTPEEAFVIRNVRWEKFKQHFIPSVVQDCINKELFSKHSNLSFTIDPEDWLVVTWVPVFYYHYGHVQKDEAEIPAYIEATSRFMLEGEFVGPRVTMKIIPPRRKDEDYKFVNLDEIIRGALGDKFLKDDGGFFTVADIMSDETAPPTGKETAMLVDRLTEALVEMGYGRRGASQAAGKVVAANPGLDSIDELLDRVIQGL